MSYVQCLATQRLKPLTLQRDEVTTTSEASNSFFSAIVMQTSNLS